MPDERVNVVGAAGSASNTEAGSVIDPALASVEHMKLAPVELVPATALNPETVTIWFADPPVHVTVNPFARVIATGVGVLAVASGNIG